MRTTEKTDWFVMWCADKESMIATMARNMAADIEAGYSYFGKSIQTQLKDIADYKAKYEADLDHIADMDANKVNHWCYVQLVKSGAITA